MSLYFLKTFHIIGFVAWFGGLFYLVRILVYHQEALSKSDELKAVLLPQYQLMESRVSKIICTPAMIFTWACGIGMLILNPGYFQFAWIHAKLFVLVLLTAYHIYAIKLTKDIDNPNHSFSDLFFRILNEIPTILLAIIVALAVFRHNINFLYLGIGILVFIGMIGWGIVAYRKKRISNIQ